MGTIAIPDSELVEASRRGELDAFGRLVARYQDVVCAVSYSSTGDRALSEDVAQETFVAAWQQIGRARPATLRPWLCGIARNLGHKARRKTRREQPLGDEERGATGATPFDDLARADAERVVRQALARVPETYREVLVLYYRENQSIREVAETLGIGEDAVMQRLSRGRRYLADSVTVLVERSLSDGHPRRDLVAAVLAAIAVFAIPAGVHAAPLPAKGSTMLKLAVAASALAVVVGATLYFARGGLDVSATAQAAAPLLHYGAGPAHTPALGPTAPTHFVAARATSVDDLALLPTDSEVVIGIDADRIRNSGLWRQYVVPALANAPVMRQFVQKCGFEPIAALASMTVGIKSVGQDGDGAGVIVVHGLPKANMTACAQLVDASDEGITVRADGDTVLYTTSRGPLAGFTFLDDSTAVVVIGPDATKDGIARIAAGGKNAGAAGYGELLHEINTDDALWLAVTDGSSLLATINTDLVAPHTAVRLHAVYGSIGVSDGLIVNAGARTGSPDLVAKLVADLQIHFNDLSTRGVLSQYVDELDVEADGGDVIVSVAINALQLLNLASAGSVSPESDVGSDHIGFGVGVDLAGGS